MPRPEEPPPSTERPQPGAGLSLEVFERAPVGVLVSQGPRHVLVFANAMYREIFGDRPAGAPIREAFPDLRQTEYLDAFDEVLRTGTTANWTATPVTVSYPRGGVEERYFSFSLSRITEGGAEYGVLAVVVEVTGHVTASQRMRILAEERSRALNRYQSLVATGTQKVWVTDASGRIVERSHAWEEVTGMTWDEIRGDGWLDSAHPQDHEALARAWKAAVRDAPELFEYVYRLRHTDGTYHHCELRAVPIREAGTVVEWVGACTDIEERWQRERRREILSRAAAAVSESSSASHAFAALSEVIVPSLADQCGIYLFPDMSAPQPSDGPLAVRRVAATAREGLPPGLPRPGVERVPPDTAFARAVRERRPVQVSFPPGATPGDAVVPGTRAWHDLVGTHNGVVVPVFIDGALAAVITSYVCGDRDPIGEGDLILMRELLEQAHDPLRHVLEFQRTQRIALALQHSLLTKPPELPGLRIEARYLPSPTSAAVGGDWYDAFTLPDGITALVIGDVAGHDLQAAVTMGMMRNMLRGLAMDRREPPGDIMRRMDVATQSLDPEQATATCVFGRIENGDGGPRSFRYSTAGHPPPLLVRRDGTAVFLTGARNPLLGGVSPEDSRTSAQAPLPAGSTLVLYTDGLIESPDEDIDQGLERLRRRAGHLAGEPVDAFCEELLAHPAGSGRDDIALIALRVLAD